MGAGDDRTGFSGAVLDANELRAVLSKGPLGDYSRMKTLKSIDAGSAPAVEASSRLGAYHATRGYRRGTVGFAVHGAIGLLYVKFGAWGQERIGNVFNSAKAKALFRKPVRGGASLQMARIEFAYWQDVLREDPWSAGAKIATKFSPEVRDTIQRTLGGK